MNGDTATDPTMIASQGLRQQHLASSPDEILSLTLVPGLNSDQLEPFGDHGFLLPVSHSHSSEDPAFCPERDWPKGKSGVSG